MYGVGVSDVDDIHAIILCELDIASIVPGNVELTREYLSSLFGVCEIVCRDCVESASLFGQDGGEVVGDESQSGDAPSKV